MRISKKFGSYNERRYSRPWIGLVTSWSVGGKAEMAWGSYIGDDNGGEVEIDAQPGDIVRYGQKDNRGNNTSAEWGIVQAGGAISDCDAVEARRAWDARQTAPTTSIDLSSISDADLLAEIKKRGLI
jgi:hypothetical protein